MKCHENHFLKVFSLHCIQAKRGRISDQNAERVYKKKFKNLGNFE